MADFKKLYEVSLIPCPNEESLFILLLFFEDGVVSTIVNECESEVDKEIKNRFLLANMDLPAKDPFGTLVFTFNDDPNQNFRISRKVLEELTLSRVGDTIIKAIQAQKDREKTISSMW
jgi:hypothetical protein